uniref:Large ribosomal subunit protein uL18c n=1 Tax=Riquetophycus sp. TaxID=1897556 RepID=A0A1C9C8F1_9FLOR|nr:ribosomal protein L18 [Riquetophycus sp.]
MKGNLERPRFYVFKSNKHIYVQIINDIENKIICSSSSISSDLKQSIPTNINCDTAYTVGQNIARKAIQRGILNVVFDRGNRLYHGHIKALANGARKEGINF